MKHLLLIALLFANQAYSQDFSEQNLETAITEVTVYLQGGLVSRTGESEIPQGKSILSIKSLSPHIDEKSIQVKAKGEFTILSVNHRLNYLSKLKKDLRIDSLSQEIASLEFGISTNESRLQILLEKQSLLNENKYLGSEAASASLTQIKQAIEFYDKELTSIKTEEIKVKLKIKDLNEQKERIEREISTAAGKKGLPTGEIEIRIEASKRTEGSFSISYLVANTGWYPKYDVRVTTVDQPLKLNYKADVYQNTGVDWENVKLKLSNGNPNESGVVPDLETWYLNYARNQIFSRATYGAISKSVRNVSGTVLDAASGEPLPGVNVNVRGTTVGTVTDLDGNYSLTLPNAATHLRIAFIGCTTQEVPMTSETINVQLQPDIRQLSEVVVTGYASQLRGKVAGINVRGNSSLNLEADMISTTTIENQTTVEFEVDTPYSIKSNGEKLSVDLKSFEIETLYEYYAVPKLEKEAFLIARIINWDQYNLLEGEANLYFEDAFVGRSVLDARSLNDTLNISLGRDKSIVIGREKVEEFSERKTIGTNKIETREFKIVARNKKSQAIKLTLFDQIPVAAINDISITPTALSKGKLNEKTGEVLWEIELEPQEQIALKLGYEVKYPKREKVILE
jgi:hypothetical protein